MLPWASATSGLWRGRDAVHNPAIWGHSRSANSWTPTEGAKINSVATAAPPSWILSILHPSPSVPHSTLHLPLLWLTFPLPILPHQPIRPFPMSYLPQWVHRSPPVAMERLQPSGRPAAEHHTAVRQSPTVERVFCCQLAHIRKRSLWVS